MHHHVFISDHPDPASVPPCAVLQTRSVPTKAGRRTPNRLLPIGSAPGAVVGATTSGARRLSPPRSLDASELFSFEAGASLGAYELPKHPRGTPSVAGTTRARSPRRSVSAAAAAGAGAGAGAGSSAFPRGFPAAPGVCEGERGSVGEKQKGTERKMKAPRRRFVGSPQCSSLPSPLTCPPHAFQRPRRRLLLA